MKKYIGIIIILLIPMIFICIYSTFEGEISFTFEKVDIASHFRMKSVESDTIAKVAEVAETDTVICDTTTQRILFFGDSMLEGLGRRMREYAGKNRHELMNVIWYSSSTKVWAQNIDTLSHFINSFKPTYIFICVGSNELFIKDLNNRDEYIKTIVARIDTIPYIWIGPPNWKEDTGINDLIKKNVGDKRFFPSKRLKYERASDGAHPTMSSAAKWMDSIAVWMTDSITYRISMRPPQEDVQPQGEIILLKPL